ncbi:mechanosensitive ion channel [Roseomonas sp. E05]|uniref:mechanosensitive ion channel domain-containing protein n=1 Tax=Roseomonas sp. E05 TaxID=3046310 RepID=UPI0024BA7F1D|nr:mechanosensitive ion channel domain-containing protein [Roseomonas sp. E05]MDJ0387983.1 mechanosensitive ion channel [Roseomonas sp. E05]
MRFLLLALFSLWLSLSHAQAQAPAVPPAAPPPSEASLQELLRVLEDDTARAALIARLRTAEGATAAATLPPEQEPTVARQLAEYSQSIAEQAVTMLRRVVEVGRGLAQLAGEAAQADRDVLWSGTFTILLLIGVVGGLFALLRMLAKPLFNALGRRAEGRGRLFRLALQPVALLIEAATVLLAWGGGYLFALSYGVTGVIAVQQTLLLNAFLAVEGIKVVIRTLFRPRLRALRPLPLGDEGARAWFFWLSRATSVIGYTFMLLAPLLNANASWAAARSLRFLVMLLVLAMGILALLRHRRAGRHWVEAQRHRRGIRLLGSVWVAFGHVWHLLAMLYLVTLFLAWVANPREALGFILLATLYSLAVVALGALLMHGLRHLFSGGISLPEAVTGRLPLLQHRLNTLIPAILRVLRGVVLVLVLLGLLQAWALFDLLSWLATSSGQRFAGALLSAALIVLAGMAAHLALSSWVEYRLNPNYGTVPTPRERTLLALFRNAATLTLLVLVAMLALSELGVNIGPLLAGAGVVGLAVGFGAQKLVQDIITGAFIQIENAMNEGDVVTAGGISGVVEKLTIRSVSIRDLNGTLHVVPFSTVDTVANMTKDFAFHVAEIGVAYRESIPEVKAAMQDAFEQLQKTEHGAFIIGPLDMQGITQFADSAVVVRARIKTQAGKHWGAGRAYNEIIKEIFDARGIEIPFPHVTLYMGEDKQGKAPPVRVIDETPRPAAAQPALAAQRSPSEEDPVADKNAKGMVADPPNRARLHRG